MDKKPDLVVWDEIDGYKARKMPYPTNLGAPKFDQLDTTNIKTESAKKMIDVFNIEKAELIKKIEKLYEEYNDSVMVWESKMSFEPLVGKVYHLYDFDGVKTLSILAPNEWNKNSCFIGSFLLNLDKKWIKT